jgi:hypothetical protein
MRRALIFCLALTQLEFSRHFFKDVSQYNISRKWRAVDAELFHAEGQSDMSKLTVAFCKVAKSDYSVCSSVYPTARINSARNRQIFMKFDTEYFLKICQENSSFIYI